MGLCQVGFSWVMFEAGLITVREMLEVRVGRNHFKARIWSNHISYEGNCMSLECRGLCVAIENSKTTSKVYRGQMCGNCGAACGTIGA
jgi:hypothetical protein